MLKSCLSFSYKITTTSRQQSQRYIRTLLNAQPSSNNSFQNCQSISSNQRSYTNHRNPLFASSFSPPPATATSIMPKRTKGQKFYAVAVGRTPGIYPTWEECQSNVNGYPNARFKKFSTEEEAKSFIASNSKTVPNNSNTLGVTESVTKQKRRKVESAKIPEDPSLGSSANPIALDSPAAKEQKHRKVNGTKIRPPTKPVALNSPAARAENPTNRDADAIGTTTSETNPLNADDESAGNQCPSKLVFHVMFDGGSRGNPHGHAGAGAYILQRSFFASEYESSTKKAPTEILRHTTRTRNYLGLGKLTNNQAEYMGLITGLKQVITALEKIYSPDSESRILEDVTVLVQGDSDLIVKQMKGIYACKSANLKSYHYRTKGLVKKVEKKLKTMGATWEITFEHVYRENNKIADGLANEAMDAQRSWTTSEGQDRRKDDAKLEKKAVSKQLGAKSDEDEDAIEV